MDLPSGEAFLHLDEIDSTNAEARRRAAAGERGPLWILADRQGAGRGRRGRVWQSAPGNFLASLLMTTDLSPAHRPRLSFAAALAVHDAVASVRAEAGRDPAALTLKWPNDLLLGGAKLAGILLESEGDRMIVGIGVNLAAAPALEDRRTAALDVAIDPVAFLARLAPAFLRRRGESFPTIREAWLERAMPPGSPLAVHSGDRRLLGRFAGIDEDGALLLEGADGRMERLSAGDVFPLDADS